jgi:CelD/BcsL family acetyltransferase involved in cellulose biosynthesis
MKIDVITSETALMGIVREWKILQSRAARFPFANPGLFIVWWRMRGRQTGRRLHVVTGRENGELVALAPLVTTRRWGMRVLEWGGGELLDYCDTLLLDQTYNGPLWDAVRQSKLYDFGLLRDIHPGASCHPALATFAQQKGSVRDYRIRFEWPSSAAWMSDALSASTRSYYHRAERRFSQQGPLRFETCCGNPLPSRVLDAMIRQKVEWLEANN